MKEVLNAIDNYMNETIKKDYVFSEDEYMTILNKLFVLKKHIEMLAAYETKRNDSKEQ